MSEIIGSAAHFVACACGKHGYIQCATGYIFAEIVSREGGRFALRAGVRMGKITPEEVPEVQRQMDQVEELAPSSMLVAPEVREVKIMLNVILMYTPKDQLPLPWNLHRFFN